MGNRSSGFADESEAITFTSEVNELVLAHKLLAAAKKMKEAASSPKKRKLVQATDIQSLMGFLENPNPEICSIILETIRILIDDRAIRSLFQKSEMKAIAKASLSENEAIQKAADDIFSAFAISDHRISTMSKQCLLKVTDSSKFLQLFALINVGISDRSPENAEQMLAALKALILESKDKAKITEYPLDCEEAGNLTRLLDNEEIAIANDAAIILASFLDGNPTNQDAAHDAGATYRLVTLLTREDNKNPAVAIQAIACLSKDHGASTQAILGERTLATLSGILGSKQSSQEARYYAASIIYETSTNDLHRTSLLTPDILTSLIQACQDAHLNTRQLASKTLAKLSQKKRKETASTLNKIEDSIAILLTLTESCDNEEQSFSIETLKALSPIGSIQKKLIALSAHTAFIPLLRGSCISVKKAILVLLTTLAKHDKKARETIRRSMNPFLNTLLSSENEGLIKQTNLLMEPLMSHLLELIARISRNGSKDCLSAFSELKNIAQCNEQSRTFLKQNAGYLTHIGLILITGGKKAKAAAIALTAAVTQKEVPTQSHRASGGGEKSTPPKNSSIVETLCALSETPSGRRSMKLNNAIERRSADMSRTTSCDLSKRTSVQLHRHSILRLSQAIASTAQAQQKSRVITEDAGGASPT